MNGDSVGAAAADADALEEKAVEKSSVNTFKDVQNVNWLTDWLTDLLNDNKQSCCCWRWWRCYKCKMLLKIFKIAERRSLTDWLHYNSESGAAGDVADGKEAEAVEKSSVVTFQNRKSVKKLKGIATVSKFRETFDKKWL